MTQVNDTLGFHCKLLQEGGVTPSGAPDTTNQSDRYDAMVNVIRREIAETSHDQFVLSSEVAGIVRGTITNSVNLTDSDIFSPVLGVGQYHQSLSSYATYDRNYPKESAGSLTVAQSSSEGVNYTYRDFNTGETYICGYYNEAWSSWERIYDTSNPPTAAEVGALSVDGKADDSKLLDGRSTSINDTENTIVLRTGSGNVYANNFYEGSVRLADKYAQLGDNVTFDTVSASTFDFSRPNDSIESSKIAGGSILFKEAGTESVKVMPIADLLTYLRTQIT